MSDLQFTLIIPAAGSGNRMGAEVPKPYLLLKNRAILERTLSQFAELPGLKQVIIAASPTYMKKTEELCHFLGSEVDVVVTEGGGSRQESVFNALKFVKSEIDMVAIHDAVRPFTEQQQILVCMDKASEWGAAILAIPVKDTVKEVNADKFIVGTPDRSRLWQAQTPQIFRRETIIRAHERAKEMGFRGTDDASLLEFTGEPIAVVEGSRENIKVTFPVDLLLAELMLERNGGG